MHPARSHRWRLGRRVHQGQGRPYGRLLLTISFRTSTTARAALRRLHRDRGQVLGMADSSLKIIPGHGAVSTKAELKFWRDMLSTIRVRVKKQIDAGKSLDAIKKMKLTTEWDENWARSSSILTRSSSSLQGDQGLALTARANAAARCGYLTRTRQ